MKLIYEEWEPHTWLITYLDVSDMRYQKVWRCRGRNQ